MGGVGHGVGPPTVCAFSSRPGATSTTTTRSTPPAHSLLGVHMPLGVAFLVGFLAGVFLNSAR
ncbi:hypothetical protein [Streptomyces sp. NPDC058964]|uniref:hypothetical protein n=1 Tax=Streptomyces sp. NPDC058964 TaxID=3346681 RepID=UPI0036989E59